MSRSRAQALIDEGAVRLDGVTAVRASARADADVLEIEGDLEVSRPFDARGLEAPVIVHEDEALIVVDKPAGVVVHPAPGHQGATLVDALVPRYPELAELEPRDRPGIVHRLDRGTSGVLLVARTAESCDRLSAAIAERRVDRTYRALVWGHVSSDEGVVDAPLGRSPRDPTRRAVVEDGKPARTRYSVAARFDDPEPLTLLTCTLETGRTHQIRVHLAAIDHPVVGDRQYGGRRSAIELGRPFLHASRLAFDHPITGQRLECSADLPPELTAVLDRIS